jgi:hypothetical protein
MGESLDTTPESTVPPGEAGEAPGGCDSITSEMPKGYPRTGCRGCGRPLAVIGSVSKRGLCDDCGTARRNANLACLVTHSGPYFDHWRRRSLAALGVIVLDEPESGR